MNMGKQVANAPGSTGVKKMLGGGMASMTPPSMFGKGRKSGLGPKPAPGGAGANFGAALTKLGAPKMSAVRGMAMGGMVDGYAKGGKVTRADGCCMKGKTKGMMR
jgi:hypothetical protein